MSRQFDIAGIRKDYKLRSFLEEDAASSPYEQFSTWWHEAAQSEIEEYNAMTLCTCNKEGKPSARVVLLKGFSEEGFTFYTNYESKKGQELHDNPNVAIVFFWKELERQIRIEGKAYKTPTSNSDHYFASRPLGSRLGAWSSPQSAVIPGREFLDKSLQETTARFGDGLIPRPAHWGGFTIKAELFEFWQGRPSRLHDRIEYIPVPNNNWEKRRLAP